MHIVDGALSTEILITGALVTTAGTALGLRQLTLEKIPAAGILSATFFVSSLLHVPVGPSSAHLIMNGLAGLVLGWTAFPALLAGLILQAVFFGFGGLAVLGVNAMNIALPAVLIGMAFRPLIRQQASPRNAALAGGMAGGLAVALTGVMVALVLALSGEEFIAAAWATLGAHIPVMIVEALVCGAAVSLLQQVRPDVLAFHQDVKSPAISGGEAEPCPS